MVEDKEAHGVTESQNNENGNVQLTEAENEVYDRQIRLWGLEAQKRLRTAKVLISGLNGLGAEVAKNIILAGVDSVMLHDVKCVAEEDLCAQFFVSKDDLGKNRAEASLAYAKSLNPHVKISADSRCLGQTDASFCTQFDVVLIMDVNESIVQHVSELCHENNVKFFAADVWGFFGYYFCDLQTHNCVVEQFVHNKVRKTTGPPTVEVTSVSVPLEMKFMKYSEILSILSDLLPPDRIRPKVKRCGRGYQLLRLLQLFRNSKGRDPSIKYREEDLAELAKVTEKVCDHDPILKEVLDCLFGQISPICGIVGGVLAQEIIKVVTKMDAPHGNLFVFDPMRCLGYSQMFEYPILSS